MKDLTRLQAKVLRYVVAHPGRETWRIAGAIGHRPYYVPTWKASS